MQIKQLEKISSEIDDIKNQISKMKVFRPGSITQQYSNPKIKKGGYYQLNYMYRMKSTTEYVCSEYLEEIQQQNSDYKKFKKLFDRWIELGIIYSKEKIKSEIKSKKSKPNV